MQYYVAINDYRSSTSHGFVNTWRVVSYRSKAERNKVLRDGLLVKDVWFSDGLPVYSTMGIRAATRQEIKKFLTQA